MDMEQLPKNVLLPEKKLEMLSSITQPHDAFTQHTGILHSAFVRRMKSPSVNGVTKEKGGDPRAKRAASALPCPP